MAFKTLAEFLALLDNVKPASGGRFMARCPGHADGAGPGEQSLSVSLDGQKILIKCFADCETAEIVKAMNLELKDLFLVKEDAPRRSEKHIGKTYDYTDAQGHLEFQVVRYVPKSFKQRRPGGKDDWIWSLYEHDPAYPNDPKKKRLAVRLFLYHLPEVVRAIQENQFVICAEGEKDVETLRSMGFIATCNPMGAGKWRDEYSDSLRGAHVVIIPDNDEPGRKHATEVGQSLQGKAASTRLLTLTGSDIKDVTNWVEKGGTGEQLEALIQTLPEWTPEPAPIQEQRRLPEINISSTHLRNLVNESLEALIAANDPPILFVRAGQVVRLIRDEHNIPKIDSMNEYSLRGRMERVANYVRTTLKDNIIPTDPPMSIVRDLITLGEWAFPPLSGITETPAIRPDGSILETPGYDPLTELYYAPLPSLRLPPIPEEPTEQHITQSLDLLKEIICNFPFDDEASHANTLAAIMTPVLRNLIPGLVPMVLFDKPQAGTGASLLADVITAIATGRTGSMINPPKDDDEFRKMITSLMMVGTNIITIDNIEKKLFSVSLSKALTDTTWKDRILGKSETPSFPNRTIWIGTGNNIRLGGDLPRRCYRVRLNAKEARPWQRTGFKHPHLIQWVLEERGRIIAAILTMAQAWIQEGKPLSNSIPVLGGYETWVETISSILTLAGEDKFLSTMEEVYEDSDEDTPQWENFISIWHDTLKEEFYTVPELTTRIHGNPELTSTLPLDLVDDLEEKGFTRKLGKALSKRAGVQFNNDLVIQKGRVEHKALTWAIKPKTWKLEESKQEKLGIDIEI